MLTQYINKMNHVSGNPNSKIIMEVYEDYECEHCGKAFRELKALREYFKEEICLIYKHLFYCTDASIRTISFPNCGIMRFTTKTFTGA